MGDNGKEEVKPQPVPQLTAEQLASERLSRYQKDPDSFIELSEIIFTAVKNHKSQMGISLWFGNCSRMIMDIAWAELNHKLQNLMSKMDMEAEMKRQEAQGLVKPAHNIMDFMRKKR